MRNPIVVNLFFLTPDLPLPLIIECTSIYPGFYLIDIAREKLIPALWHGREATEMRNGSIKTSIVDIYQYILVASEAYISGRRALCMAVITVCLENGLDNGSIADSNRITRDAGSRGV